MCISEGKNPNLAQNTLNSLRDQIDQTVAATSIIMIIVTLVMVILAQFFEHRSSRE